MIKKRLQRYLDIPSKEEVIKEITKEVIKEMKHKEQMYERIKDALCYIITDKREEYDSEWNEDTGMYDENFKVHKSDFKLIVTETIQEKCTEAVEAHLKADDWLDGIVKRLLNKQLFKP